jgi:D-alanine--poly(phosphoribitol) ligase subunit 1
MQFSFDRFDFIEPATGTQRPAVIDAAGTLDWQQLSQAVEQWERQALARGARRDEPLLITGHKEAAFLVAILGCLRLGVPFVPVDVINPPERMARIATLVQAGLHYDAQACGFLDTGIAAQPLQEKSLAYIMFTSGCRGDPKGVKIGR